jgi:DNA-directed RNA polymerase
MVGNKMVKKWISVEDDVKLDVDKQVNGLAPNFVHSLDAAALMASTREAAQHGVKSFAMVHDSYGTLAAHTRVLDHYLRTAFVDMYLKHDVLAELREAIVAALGPDAKIPVLPPQGKLNIEEVLESKFFFA